MRPIKYLIVLYAILLTACRQLQTLPTVTPSPTFSPLLSITNTPVATSTATVTLKPGVMPSSATPPLHPTKTLDIISVFLPTGRAAFEWNGVPILPYAFAGKELEDESGYQFTVYGNTATVLKFYTLQLPRLGWTLSGMKEGDDGSKILEFRKGNDILSVSILVIDEAERLVLVTIVRA
jgi:hypothetical protein